ncbi:hypothetical protein HA466_0008960 [Hirschfeldia incana]|nr:hypothetical protein HA466_0008960 [Hirschfeldia incana]KAJ0267002.1 hypothetical protein HA466_0008960 [Hirschfeldia incana]
MWKNCPPRYDHGVKREVKVNLVYPEYDHDVIQRIRKRHDDCSVFVNKDDEKGLNVVFISSVETFGGQGETFRAAVELYPQCVYQTVSNSYDVDFLVGESQNGWLYSEEEVALFWGEVQDMKKKDGVAVTGLVPFFLPHVNQVRRSRVVCFICSFLLLLLN